MTAYENINSLLPGEYITIENNKLSIQKYEVENTFYENLNQLKFKDIIKDSIKINLRSDVNLWFNDEQWFRLKYNSKRSS